MLKNSQVNSSVSFLYVIKNDIDDVSKNIVFLMSVNNLLTPDGDDYDEEGNEIENDQLKWIAKENCNPYNLKLDLDRERQYIPISWSKVVSFDTTTICAISGGQMLYTIKKPTSGLRFFSLCHHENLVFHIGGQTKHEQ